MKDLILREYNKKPHQDIEIELQKKKNGVFTFIIKVSGGNIVDLVFLENDKYRETA